MKYVSELIMKNQIANDVHNKFILFLRVFSDAQIAKLDAGCRTTFHRVESTVTSALGNLSSVETYTIFHHERTLGNHTNDFAHLQPHHFAVFFFSREEVLIIPSGFHGYLYEGAVYPHRIEAYLSASPYTSWENVCHEWQNQIL